MVVGGISLLQGMCCLFQFTFGWFVSVFCLLFVLMSKGLLFLARHLIAPRKLGDTSYLRWTR